jgi:hypothetical protein
MTAGNKASRNGKPRHSVAKAPKPDPKARQVRRRILTRWLELAEDLRHLENAIKNSPKGAFTQDELDDCDWAMDRVWDHMTNNRPKLDPSSAERRASWERYLKRVAHRNALLKQWEESKVAAAIQEGGVA